MDVSEESSARSSERSLVKSTFCVYVERSASGFNPGGRGG